MFGERTGHEKEDLCNEIKAAIGPDIPNPVFMDSELNYICGLTGSYRTLAIQQAVLGQLKQFNVDPSRQAALSKRISELSVNLQIYEEDIARSSRDVIRRSMSRQLEQLEWDDQGYSRPNRYGSNFGEHHPYNPTHVNCIACAPENDPPVTSTRPLPYGTKSGLAVAEAKRARRIGPIGIKQRFQGLWSNVNSNIVPIGPKIQDTHTDPEKILGSWGTATYQQSDRDRIREQTPYIRVRSELDPIPKTRPGVVIPIDQYSDYTNHGVTDITRRQKKVTVENTSVTVTNTTRMVPASKGRKFRNNREA